MKHGKAAEHRHQRACAQRACVRDLAGYHARLQGGLTSRTKKPDSMPWKCVSMCGGLSRRGGKQARRAACSVASFAYLLMPEDGKFFLPHLHPEQCKGTGSKQRCDRVRLRLQRFRSRPQRGRGL